MAGQQQIHLVLTRQAVQPGRDDGGELLRAGDRIQRLGPVLGARSVQAAPGAIHRNADAEAPGDLRSGGDLGALGGGRRPAPQVRVQLALRNRGHLVEGAHPRRQRREPLVRRGGRRRAGAQRGLMDGGGASLRDPVERRTRAAGPRRRGFEQRPGGEPPRAVRRPGVIAKSRDRVPERGADAGGDLVQDAGQTSRRDGVRADLRKQHLGGALADPQEAHVAQQLRGAVALHVAAAAQHLDRGVGRLGRQLRAGHLGGHQQFGWHVDAVVEPVREHAAGGDHGLVRAGERVQPPPHERIFVEPPDGHGPPGREAVCEQPRARDRAGPDRAHGEAPEGQARVHRRQALAWPAEQRVRGHVGVVEVDEVVRRRPDPHRVELGPDLDPRIGPAHAGRRQPPPVRRLCLGQDGDEIRPGRLPDEHLRPGQPPPVPGRLGLQPAVHRAGVRPGLRLGHRQRSGQLPARDLAERRLAQRRRAEVQQRQGTRAVQHAPGRDVDVDRRHLLDHLEAPAIAEVGAPERGRQVDAPDAGAVQPLEQARRQLPPLIHLVDIEVGRDRAYPRLYRRRTNAPVLDRLHLIINVHPPAAQHQIRTGSSQTTAAEARGRAWFPGRSASCRC